MIKSNFQKKITTLTNHFDKNPSVFVFITKHRCPYVTLVSLFNHLFISHLYLCFCLVNHAVSTKRCFVFKQRQFFQNCLLRCLIVFYVQFFQQTGQSYKKFLTLSSLFLLNTC